MSILFKFSFGIALLSGLLFAIWSSVRKQGSPISKIEGQLGNIGLQVFVISLLLAVIVGGIKTCGNDSTHNNEHYLHSD